MPRDTYELKKKSITVQSQKKKKKRMPRELWNLNRKEAK
jgi:hypothetical protein